MQEEKKQDFIPKPSSNNNINNNKNWICKKCNHRLNKPTDNKCTRCKKDREDTNKIINQIEQKIKNPEIKSLPLLRCYESDIFFQEMTLNILRLRFDPNIPIIVISISGNAGVG